MGHEATTTRTARALGACLLIAFSPAWWFGAEFQAAYHPRDRWMVGAGLAAHLLGAAGMLADRRWGGALAITCACLWVAALALAFLVGLQVIPTRQISVPLLLLTPAVGVALLVAWVLVACLGWRQLRRLRPS